MWRSRKFLLTRDSVNHKSNHRIDQSNCKTVVTYQNKFTTPPHQYRRTYTIHIILYIIYLNAPYTFISQHPSNILWILVLLSFSQIDIASQTLWTVILKGVIFISKQHSMIRYHHIIIHTHITPKGCKCIFWTHVCRHRPARLQGNPEDEFLRFATNYWTNEL